MSWAFAKPFREPGERWDKPKRQVQEFRRPGRVVPLPHRGESLWHTFGKPGSRLNNKPLEPTRVLIPSFQPN